MNADRFPEPVAIVGMSGCFSGARDLRQYWQNIVDGVDAVVDADEEWLGPYFDPDSKENDRIYTKKGGFLNDLAEFNPVEFGIMPTAVDGGEPDHYLALRLARDALRDADYIDRSFNREKAGIVLGRGTYINRGYTTLMQHGMMVDQTLAVVRQLRPDLDDQDIAELRAGLKKQLPAFNTEMSPGLVPNVTTGIIANRLDLMGPNYILDAACASSLIAVESACRELFSGRCEMVLTGGCQAHTPPQLMMIFCQLGALTRGNIRPFDVGASGTLLGEGAGMLVLKKLSDAERDNDNIYAVIRGLGTSSDGKAKGLLAPRLEGEVLALKRAYESCDIDPATVGLIEAHGTGIALGDKTEIQSLGSIFGARAPDADLPRTGIGSVKSMISHCIPAAGAAAMIKTALALHHKVLPPTLCDEVNPALHLEETPFYINNETRPWVHGAAHPRRAGVNSFGFGGVNAHAILEEYIPTDTRIAAKRPVAPDDAMLHASATELVVLAAPSNQAMIEAVRRLKVRIENDQTLSLPSIAKATADSSGEHRLAIVAANVEELCEKLDAAMQKLADNKPFKTRQGVHYSFGDMPGKLAFLFPGEGAQYTNMLAELALHFPQVREWFDFIDATSDHRDIKPSEVIFPVPTGLPGLARRELEARIYDMDLASETVFTASMALFTLLSDLGVSPDVMVGHSTGENTALVASQTLRAASRVDLADAIRRMNTIYQELDRAGEIESGALLTVGAMNAERRGEVLDSFSDKLVVAMDNCPNQVVLYGNRDDVEQAQKALTAAGAVCALLPFGRAYHTERFQPVATAFRKFYEDTDMGPGIAEVYSCATAAPFPEEPTAIRDLACAQWATTVRFSDTINRLVDDGVGILVEVGPSANLTSFVGDILGKRHPAVAMSCDSRRRGGMKQFQSLLATLFANGVSMDLTTLYRHRDIPVMDLETIPAKGKPRQHLNLHLPALHIPDDWEPARRLNRRSTDMDPTSIPKGPKVVPLKETVAPEPAPARQAQPAIPASNDPRLAAVRSHFELMQQFLASQARVFGVAPAEMPDMPGQPQTAGIAPAAEPATPPNPATGQLDRSAFPMLGEMIELTDRRLLSQRIYTLENDPFLMDHTIGSEPSAVDPSLLPLPVMPFTFSMEILAEAAVRLAGGQVVEMREVRGHRWLALDDGTLTLNIEAERQGPDTVRGRLYLDAPERPNGQVLVFEGIVRIGQQHHAPATPIEWTSPNSYGARSNPDGELYSHGMFHGPRLQGVQHLRRWAEEAIEADMLALPTHNYFAFTQTPRLQLDPALLDAAGQLAGYWLTEKHGWGFNCFPFRLGRFTPYAPPPAAGTEVICRGDLKLTDPQRLEAAFDMIDGNGRLLMRCENWEDRKFSVPDRYYNYRLRPQSEFISDEHDAGRSDGLITRMLVPFEEGFLDQGWGIWKRMLAHMALSRHERAAFYNLPLTGPRREEWLMGRIAVKDAVREWAATRHGLHLAPADVEIITDEMGAPSVRCAALQKVGAPMVSVAHSRRYAVATAAEVSVGVDYQRIAQVRLEELIRGAMTEQEARVIRGAPAPDQPRIAVAIWSAKEAAAKSVGTGLEGRPRDWNCQFTSIDRLGSQPTRAQVIHGETRHDVTVYFEGTDAVLAICLEGDRMAADPTVLRSIATTSG
ncbi:beta-ketoacyl synthase N-terminal-like domain-containing protein [uncultured Abyssibacter sp.]|uniref:beta-ketoacyl synthase N-terminal-like domain-containing protein n=1 Tax=uncultured Abyssibacter sp. TaxID=2320202 RepID=UPI0032B2ECE3